MDEFIYLLGETTVFTNLNANSIYWQIEIEKEDKDKTSFTSHHGSCCSVRMPFGLKNDPVIFRQTIDVLLLGVKRQNALVCLDKIFIFSKTLKGHI